MTTVSEINSEHALRHCRDITRRRARNFYYGLKLLPEPQRSSLYAVYAWMRLADDIADDCQGNPERAVNRIEDLRQQTMATLAGENHADDPVLIGLGHVRSRFDLPVDPFHDVLTGQLDDLNGRVYETFDDLKRYCRRVASSVGLICIEIWGYDGDRAPELAEDRGIALQLTNILRDFREDFDAGRVYLPDEDFDRHNLAPSQLRDWSEPRKCTEFMDEQIERAGSYYVSSAPLDGMIEPACRPTLWAMTEIYRRLLEKMKRAPDAIVADKRIRLNSFEKIGIALRARRAGS